MQDNVSSEIETETVSTVSSAMSAQDMALTSMRRAALNLVSKPASAPAPTAETVGELRLVRIKDIEVGERFRVDLGDLAAFADSIREVGLLQPILLNPSLQLVAGMRRLEAYKLLGRDAIPAQIRDIEDEGFAAMEEDRSRKGLTPTEKYASAEFLREKIRKDENWRMNAMGGRLNKAILKGRLEDFLAKHVAISRPTLIKIRTMVEAAKRDPSRFGEIVEALDRDAKVDRHYKRYLEEKAKDDANPRFKALVLAPNWQEIDEKILRKVIATMKPAEYAEEGAILLVPSSLAALPQASALLSLARFAWQSALPGNDTDGEQVWLVGTKGKTFPPDTDISLLAEACRRSHAEVRDAAFLLADGSVLPIDLGQIAYAA